MHKYAISTIGALTLASALYAAPAPATSSRSPLPRSADGKPNFEGIWQAYGSAGADLEDHAASFDMPAGRSVVVGNTIPYQPWAAAKSSGGSAYSTKARRAMHFSISSRIGITGVRLPLVA